MRVNPDEPRQYVQWAPTFGDALRPELFGELRFGSPPEDPQAHVAAYTRRHADRRQFFLQTINNIREPDALRQLGLADWTAWAAHMANRAGPVSIRWDDITPGAEGIPAAEHDLILDEANGLADQINTWSTDDPDPGAFNIAQLEVLGDAWLLCTDRRYPAAFDHALAVHAALIKQILATVTDPN